MCSICLYKLTLKKKQKKFAYINWRHIVLSWVGTWQLQKIRKNFIIIFHFYTLLSLSLSEDYFPSTTPKQFLQTSSSPFTTQKTLLLWLYFVTLYPNPNAATSIPLHFHLRWWNFWVPKPRQSLFLWICLFIYCQHCFKYFLSCYALLFPLCKNRHGEVWRNRTDDCLH